MTAGYGERLTDNVASPSTGRAYLSPPAASSWLAGGRPIDAGTAHILQSNLFHEEYESVRPLAFTLGDGNIIDKGSDGWGDVLDGGRSNPSDPGVAANPMAQISWSQKQCLRFGPFFIPQDAPDPANAGQYLARKIRFDVQIQAGSGSLKLYLALTSTAATPDLGTIAYVYEPSPSTGHLIKTLQPLVPVPASGMSWRCRAAGPVTGMPGVGSTNSQPVTIWAWVGYRGGDGDFVISTSLYEVR